MESCFNGFLIVGHVGKVIGFEVRVMGWQHPIWRTSNAVIKPEFAGGGVYGRDAVVAVIVWAIDNAGAVGFVWVLV